MTIVYRKNLNRPMSWEELDGNFEEVERIGIQSQQYANNASTSATSSASSASLAQQQMIAASDEADRAKSEADRASEIAGVTTIAEAFIPFPDVWIPFSDNLRMLAGYGDEIKVGDYTVASQAAFSRATTATYVDKDGALKTAATNEPRFEKDGLLVEPQSTNITKISEGWTEAANASPAWTHSASDADGWITVTGGGDAGAIEGSFIDFVVGAPLWSSTSTFSLDIRKDIPYSFLIRSFNELNPDGFGFVSLAFLSWSVLPSHPSLKVVDMGDWLRITHTRTFGASGLAIFRLYPFGEAVGASGALTYRRIQIENLSYATSYIKTTGAAATRAADIVTIPKSLNNCAEFYSGPNAVIVTAGADKLTISPPTGKLNVRNFRGFFTPLTAAQKAALK